MKLVLMIRADLLQIVKSIIKMDDCAKPKT